MATGFLSAYQLPGTSSCFNQFSISLTIPSSLIWMIFLPFSAEASLTFPEYPGQSVAVDFCRKYGGPPPNPSPDPDASDPDGTRPSQRFPAVRRARALHWPG